MRQKYMDSIKLNESSHIAGCSYLVAASWVPERCLRFPIPSLQVSPMGQKPDDHSLTDFTTHLALLTSCVLYSALFLRTNQLSVDELNSYPNFYYYYTLQFLGMSLLCFFACVIQYLRHSKMRKTIFAEFRNFTGWWTPLAGELSPLSGNTGPEW